MNKLILLLLLVGCNSVDSSKVEIIKSTPIFISNKTPIELYSHITKWEGHQVTNDPYDLGGLTHGGVTKHTYDHIRPRLERKGISVNSFYNLNESDIIKFIDYYYFTFNCNRLKDSRLAMVFTEAYWGGNSIVKEYINILKDYSGQELTLNSKLSGYSLTQSTCNYLNSLNEEQIIQVLHMFDMVRYNYYHNKCEKNPTQYKFLKGWINRSNDLNNLVLN